MRAHAPSASALWRFSLAFYRRPGVADACIALQDEAGLDVNVMLYLLYLATQGRRVSAGEMRAIDQRAAAWSGAVVRPLRELRRRLKQPIGDFAPAATAGLRDQVKRIELAAERIEQQALERMLAPTRGGRGDPLAVARANLAAYAARLAPLPPAPLALVLDAFERWRGARETNTRPPPAAARRRAAGPARGPARRP